MVFFDDEDDELFDDDENERERDSEPRVVLQDVSFEALGGSCVALVGPPRSGKSVLMRIIAGLSPPTSGRVVIEGRVAAALDSSRRLFPRVGRLRSALPLLAGFHGLPPRVVRRHLGEISRFLDWPTMHQQHVSQLTTKQRRALMFALALNVEADVVLIDCPLPRGVAARIQQRMLELKEKGALLIVTAPDAQSVAWIADRVVCLEGGVLVADQRVGPSIERVELASPEASGGVAADVAVSGGP